MDTERIQGTTLNLQNNFQNKKEIINPAKEDSTKEKLTKAIENVSSEKTKLPTTKLPRCDLKSCNKKIGYTGYPCHCGQTFCATHRFAKEHGCTHDYKQTERAILEKRNGNHNSRPIFS